MSLSKHSFSFQHIQNGQLILPIPNKNEQNDHNDRKQTDYLSILVFLRKDLLFKPLLFISV